MKSLQYVERSKKKYAKKGKKIKRNFKKDIDNKVTAIV